MKVINRKIVNISWDNNTARTVQVGLNFEFIPNKLIVKSIAYDTADNALFQIGSDLVYEGVLCSFNGIPMTQQLDIHFKLQQCPQNRVWQFQTQSVPTGTGPSDESGTATGVVSLMLEFLQESDK